MKEAHVVGFIHDLEFGGNLKFGVMQCVLGGAGGLKTLCWGVEYFYSQGENRHRNSRVNRASHTAL